MHLAHPGRFETRRGSAPPPVLTADWPRPSLAVAPGILLALCSRGRESSFQICRVVPIHPQDPRGLGAAGICPFVPAGPAQAPGAASRTPGPGQPAPRPTTEGSGWSYRAGRGRGRVPGSRAPFPFRLEGPGVLSQRVPVEVLFQTSLPTLCASVFPRLAIHILPPKPFLERGRMGVHLRLPPVKHPSTPAH